MARAIAIIKYDGENLNWRGMESPLFLESNGKTVFKILIKRLKKIRRIEKIILASNCDSSFQNSKRILSDVEFVKCDFSDHSWIERVTHELGDDDIVCTFIPEEPLIDWELIDSAILELSLSDLIEVEFINYVIGTYPKILIKKKGFRRRTIQNRILKKESNEFSSLALMLQFSDVWKIAILKNIILNIRGIEDMRTSGVLKLIKSENFQRKILTIGNDFNTVQKTVCEYCGNKLIKTPRPLSPPIQGLIVDNEGQYRHCTQCDLYYLKERICDSELEKIYDQPDYHKYRMNMEELTDHALYGPAKRVLEFVSSWKREGVLLDIGGGSGYFLSHFLREKNNWKCKLIDISEHACENAQKDGIDPICADITKWKSDEKFDIITMFELIEHIPVKNVVKIFKKIISLLNVDSYLFISTPNANSLWTQVYDLNFSWPYEHINLYTPQWFEKESKKIFPNCSVEIETIEETSLGWFKFWKEGAVTPQMRKLADFLLDSFSEDKTFRKFNQYIDSKKMGYYLLVKVHKEADNEKKMYHF
jgi:2-polyprenyl-3-methyl-5-hydroxy-6-metoxy-1,4-benzoquinol methylase